jgi:hypothetical protein
MFVTLMLETPKKALVHCTRPKFSTEKAHVHCTRPKFSQKRHSFIAQNKNMSPEKKLFFATTCRKDVESYFQMPGKRILAL